MPTTHFKESDLTVRYEALTASVRAICELGTEMVGGQPADKDGIRAFCVHHLKIADPQELDKAVERIAREEIGERDVTPSGGELTEKQVYGLNVIRRTEHGPYLGNWMIKACLKHAASQLYVFEHFRRSKGHWSESGKVSAISSSLVAGQADKIYLRDNSEAAPAQTYWREFMGRVSTPQGSKSICHHSECAPPGSRFAFEFRFLVGNSKLGPDDVRDVLALAMIVGIGSVKALERGKFKILDCDIEFPDKKA